MIMENDFSCLAGAAADYFRFLSENGVRGFDSPDHTETVMGWGRAAESLPGIQKSMKNCRRCPLCRTRKSIVFGSGDPHARILFVGSSPGPEEDVAGEPFMDEAGQLLTKIIQAMKLERKKVYLTNLVKCRPPGNRAPSPAEIDACLPFLRRQISSVNPDFICTLGTAAGQALLSEKKEIHGLRGRFHDLDGIRTIATHHPADLLADPRKKKEVWEDVQLIMEACGLKK